VNDLWRNLAIYVLQERYFVHGQLSSQKMSEFWQRKIRTYFHLLDLDQDGVISKNDFDLLSQSFCASEKVVPVKHEELRKHSVDVSYNSTNTFSYIETALSSVA